MDLGTDAALWLIGIAALVYFALRVKNPAKGRSRLGGGLLVGAAILVVFLVLEVPLLVLLVGLVLFGLTTPRFIKSIDAWDRKGKKRRKGTR